MNRFSRLREKVRENSSYVRFAIVASLSAVAAYGIASIVPAVASVPAALAAVVSVRPSFHEGIREGAVQILATITGGLLAATLVVTIGATPLTMGLAVFTAFATGWVLKMQTATATTITATIIIVIGTNATVDAVWARLWGVAVGALVAVLASLYTSPGVATARTLESSLKLASNLAARLEHVGRSLHAHNRGVPVSVIDVRGWLSSIEKIARDLEPVRAEAELLVDGAAWSPLTRQADAQAVLRQVMLIEVASETAANMCRDLLLTPPSSLPAELLDPIGEMFAAAARLLRDQVSLARSNPSARIVDSVDSEESDLARARKRTLEQARTLDDTAPLTLGGAMSRDALKLQMLLSEPGDVSDSTPENLGEGESMDR